MNLDDARGALEQQGFECFGGDEKGEGILTGRRSTFWSYMPKWSRQDRFVFVHHITTQLNLERIKKDLADLPDRVEQYAFAGPRPCCGRGIMIFLIYYADSMEPDASAKILQPMPSSAVTFLAAQDGQGQSFYYEPWLGGRDSEQLYWAGLLTGRDVGSDGPPHLMRRVYNNMKEKWVILAIFQTIITFSPDRWGIFLGFALMLVILVGRVVVWILSRCQKKDQSTSEASLELPLQNG
jgi:hypothetical protein